ncbi:MAG: T9SS type A sorting domain-containing protein [Ignavibacteria bacterium]
MKRILILIAFTFLTLSLSYSQWTQMGPEGAEVRDLIKSDSYLYCGTLNGIYISNNNGNNWFHSGLEQITRIAKRNNEIWVGEQSGLLYTTNNGLNWIQTNFAIQFPSRMVNTISFYNNNIFVASVFHGIYLSSNSGNNWSLINNGLPAIPNPADIISIGSNTFYADNGGGVYYSSNNGQNWIQRNNGLTNLSLQSFAASGDTLFLGISGGGVFKSYNFGQNWIEINNGLSALGIYKVYYSSNKLYAGTTQGIFFSSNSGNNWSNIGLSNRHILTIEVENTNIFVGSLSGNYLSTNNGQTWSQINNGILSLRIYSLFSKSNLLFAGLINNGVYCSSDNGQTWIEKNNGIPNSSRIKNICIANDILFAAVASSYGPEIYKSSNNGNTWSLCNNGFSGTSWIWTLHSYNGIVFAGTTGSGIFKTTNNGDNWYACNNGLSNLFIQSFCSKDNNLFTGTSIGVFVSTNNGENWGLSSSGLPAGSIIRGLAAKDGYVFAATAGSKIYRTSNNGITWIQASNGITSNDLENVYATRNCLFTFTNQNENPNNKIYISTNNGNNWSSIQTGLPRNNTLALSLIVHEGNLYAGTFYNSIFKRSLNDFVSSTSSVNLISPSNNVVNVSLTPTFDWDSITSAMTYNIQISTNSGFSTFIIDTVGILNTSLQIQQGILQNGIQYFWRVRSCNEGGYSNWSSVWNFSTTLTGLNPIKGKIPNSFSLSQNFPNPFNPTTKIKFDVPKASSVKITIFDMLGKEISILVNGKLNAGSYSVDWNANDYPSGVYFYRMESGSFSNTKQMILLK